MLNPEPVGMLITPTDSRWLSKLAYRMAGCERSSELNASGSVPPELHNHA